MTIAACYLSSEGVVVGADSTSTFPGLPDQHYNHAQKIFEVGENSTLCIAAWGMGGFGIKSYRTMIAELGDDLQRNPPAGVADVAQRWKNQFWHAYQSELAPQLARNYDLVRMSHRTFAEEQELFRLSQLSGGFCIAGRTANDRTPRAFEIVYRPLMQETERVPQPIAIGYPRFWGVPNLMLRLLYGFENDAFRAIMGSGKWTGTDAELFELLRPFFLVAPGLLPIRDAIDWIHSSIFITIKGMKFSHRAPVCGGPIEIATITSDRNFRWVSHKGLDEAIHHHTPRT
jgi:hypothetical protein